MVTQMADKHTNWYITSPVIKEMQIKTMWPQYVHIGITHNSQKHETIQMPNNWITKCYVSVKCRTTFQ